MSKKIILLLGLINIFNCSISNAGDINNTPSTSDLTADPQTKAPDPATKKVEEIQFLRPWARASLSPNNNSAVYLTIKNTSNVEYTLIGAGAMEIANNVELHQSFVDEKGISKMTPIDKITIPANSEIVLQPAGMHIMLLDLKKALKNGDKFKLALKFLTIGTKTVDVEVKANN